MANLLELCKTGRYPTDKYFPVNNWHSYIENFYNDKFALKQTSALNVLEIGIHLGDSLRLWKDYFTNANIFGIDINLPPLSNELFADQRLSIIRGNAYSGAIINVFKDEYFDIIIDDGPHTLESQILFFQKYIWKIKPNGYMVCEDIQGMDSMFHLIQTIPAQLRNNLQIIDLREIDNRSDSLILFLKR